MKFSREDAIQRIHSSSWEMSTGGDAKNKAEEKGEEETVELDVSHKEMATR